MSGGGTRGARPGGEDGGIRRPADDRLVLATDLDGTFAAGSPAERARLQAALQTHPDARLIYVTGRSADSARALVAHAALPEPDAIIADVGTSVLRGVGPERLESVERALQAHWPGAAAVRERLAEVEDLVEQDVRAPRRVSYWIAVNRARRAEGAEYEARPPDDPSLSAEAAAVAERVAGAARRALDDLDVDVVVSGNVYLDVLPGGVNKGTTLRRVLTALDADATACVVAGDSLNDLALFESGLRGIVVGNCEPALRERMRDRRGVYQAHATGAAGVLEGLRHHGTLPAERTSKEARMASDFIVLSHREPYAEIETGDGVELRRKTNGVFTTLDSVMRHRHGTWIAWKEQVQGEPFQERVRVPADDDPDAYTVRRIPLDREEARRFYYDFTSTALWPVLFSLLGRARFTRDAWETYKRVNRAFADATCEEAAEGALVWVNDFHLMLAPRLIKKRRPDLTLALFLHTTFPPPDVFAVLPWREELLDGMLHLDLIGFHIPSYAMNFANTAERFCDATPTSVTGTDLIEHGPAVAVRRYPLSLRYGDRQVGLGVYPVGVDVEFFASQAQDPATAERAAEIRQRTGAETVILSAERLDYVKGVLERLECFERFLHRHPERHGKVSFIQIAVPTRTGMEEFQEMRRQTEEAVGRINGRFGTMDWQPVLHFYGSFDRPELVAFYRAADVIWVTPLRDGLNLVAKEYVASRVGSEGVVILSEFAGAAAELDGVVLTNPYSPDDMDRALDEALSLDEGERTARMLKLRDRVLTWDVHRWAQAFLHDAERAGQAARTVL